MSAIRYLSVCSGIEVAALAWVPLGWLPVLVSEIEAFPREVLRIRHDARDARFARPADSLALWGDFTALRMRHLRRLGIDPADIDVLVGGTPCQGFSVAGLRGSLSDPRGGLSLAFLRLAHAIQSVRARAGKPGLIIVWENVPGVFSTPDNAFGCFLGALVGADDAVLPSARPAPGRANKLWRWRPAGRWPVLDDEGNETGRFREAQAADRMLRVFPSLCDPFDNQADPAVRHEWFDLIRATPHLLWLLLTKRPQNIVAMVEAVGGLPENVALGATCENQEVANRNVRHLLDAARDLYPALTFVSAEPLLGPIDFTKIDYGVSGEFRIIRDALRLSAIERIDWIITGGETDQGTHKARPSHPDWYRAIRDQCAAAGVPYLHKQNGEWQDGSAFGPAFERTEHRVIYRDGVSGPHTRDFCLQRDRDGLHTGQHPTVVARVGKKVAGRLLDGVEHNGFPEACA